MTRNELFIWQKILYLLTLLDKYVLIFLCYHAGFRMNYVISPGPEFADGRRIRGHDPNSPEFGIVSPLF